MKPRLAEWASIAEIVSGLAVVITLVFLIVGIHDNTKVMRATAFERNIEEFIDSRRILAQDPQLFDVVSRAGGESYLAMTSDEKATARVWYQANFLAYERAYFAQTYDLLGEGEYARFSRLACDSFVRFVPELRNEVMFALNKAFVDFLSKEPECEDASQWFESQGFSGN